MVTETVVFTKDNVIGYLDVCIRHWRKIRDENTDKEKAKMAPYYIDAFQSIRMSLFGECL